MKIGEGAKRIFEGRKGFPRSEEERKARHKKLFGSDSLPKRGSGKSNPYQEAANRLAIKTKMKSEKTA